MNASELYEYLLTNGGRTLADNSRPEKTLVKHGLAYINGGILRVVTFLGAQTYDNARAAVRSRIK